MIFTGKNIIHEFYWQLSDVNENEGRSEIDRATKAQRLALTV